MRPPVGLTLAGTALLTLTVLLTPAGIAPPWVALGLILIGAAPAAWGAHRKKPRWLTAGVLTQLAGIATVGPFLTSWLAWLSTLGVVFLVGAWTLSYVLNRRVEENASLLLAATATVLLAGTLGWAIAEGFGLLASQGNDARALITAWVVLATSLTWVLIRKANPEVPQ